MCVCVVCVCVCVVCVCVGGDPGGSSSKGKVLPSQLEEFKFMSTLEAYLEPLTASNFLPYFGENDSFVCFIDVYLNHNVNF